MIEDLTVEQFTEKCIRYNEENNISLGIKKPTECLVHLYASMHNKSCKGAVAGLKSCPVCNFPCCPACFSHSGITQLSRVTGYIGAVDGFNEAKKQELKDRKRYNIR